MTKPDTSESWHIFAQCSFIAAIAGIWVLWVFMATDVCLNHAASTAEEPLTRLSTDEGAEYCLPVSPVRPEREHLDYVVDWARGPVREGVPRYRLRSPDGVAMHEPIALGSCQLPRDHSFVPSCRGRIDLPQHQAAPIHLCFGHLGGAEVVYAQIGMIHGIEREAVATTAALLLLVSLGFGRAFRGRLAVRRWQVFCFGVSMVAFVTWLGPLGSTGGIALHAYRSLEALASGPLPALTAAGVFALSVWALQSPQSTRVVAAGAAVVLAVIGSACLLWVAATW